MKKFKVTTFGVAPNIMEEIHSVDFCQAAQELTEKLGFEKFEMITYYNDDCDFSLTYYSTVLFFIVK